MLGADLERHVASELRRLPYPSAPATLLPRVLAAVQAWAARPWYERAWLTWPVGWQVASVVLFAVAAVAAAAFGPSLSGLTDAFAAGITTRLGRRIPDLGSRLEIISLAVPVLWRALVYRVLLAAFVIVGLMSLACIAVAAMLNRAVFGRMSES